jgi:hypothetical protein
MEEEVAKHTKKIYRTMRGPHSFWQKVKEIAVEIFIIVFAVTLSIWLHGWSDHRHEQKEAAEFLKGLKDDLTGDLRLMEESKDSAANLNASYKVLLTPDAHRLDFMLNATHANVGRYEGFKSSGKMGIIEDDSLKQKILVYYQQTIPNIGDVENLVNGLQTRMMDLEMDEVDKPKSSGNTFLRSFKMKTLLQLTTQNIDGEIAAYTAAQGQARQIIGMIDRVLQ